MSDRNPAAVEDRVRTLLCGMDLDDKLAQMRMGSCTALSELRRFSADKAARINVAGSVRVSVKVRNSGKRGSWHTFRSAHRNPRLALGQVEADFHRAAVAAP